MAGPLARRSGLSICLIMELIKWEPDIIYEVGLGQEFHEVEVFQESWPNVALVGFEASPHLYREIKDKYPGVCLPYAIMDKVGTTKFYCKKRHKDGSSVFRLDNQDLIEVTVETETLDHLYPSGPKGDHVLLWLDCEGCELMALRGAVNFLKDVEVINIELTGRPRADEGWADPLATHKFLANAGFKRQWVHTQRSSAGQYDAIYVRRHLFDPIFCTDPWEIDGWKK